MGGNGGDWDWGRGDEQHEDFFSRDILKVMRLLDYSENK